MRAVKLHKYSKEFPKLYKKEVQRISNALTSKDIHHIGSTSIKGLPGKGIIDIMIGVNSTDEAIKIEKALLELGYIVKTSSEDDGIWIFMGNKKDTGLGDYHIHIADKSSKLYQENLQFRDLLTKYPDLVKEYASVKEDIIRLAGDDRIVYMNLKSEFIAGVLAGGN